MFSELGGGLYHVKQGNIDFKVSFLPGRIALYGTPGNQFFDNPQNLGPERLKDFDAKKAALNHLQTTVNKVRFENGLQELLRKKVIDQHNKNTISVFMMKCECSPRTIRQRLANLGYGNVVAQIDFEDPDPVFAATLGAFHIFLKEFSDYTQRRASQKRLAERREVSNDL